MPLLEKTRNREQEIDDDGVEIQPPSHNEFRIAIQQIKNYKAAEPDDLLAELFKTGGDDFVRSMH